MPDLQFCKDSPTDALEKLHRLSEFQLHSIEQPIRAPSRGTPEVFVIGGGGSGIAVYNRLQRQSIPFVAGILQENDMEYQTARALATEVIFQKAFYPLEESQIAVGIITSSDFLCIYTIKCLENYTFEQKNNSPICSILR